MICGGHNNMFGRTIDAALVRQLSLFCNLLAIRIGRGEQVATIRGLTTVPEQRVNLRPGLMSCSKSTIEDTEVGPNKRSPSSKNESSQGRRSTCQLILPVPDDTGVSAPSLSATHRDRNRKKMPRDSSSEPRNAATGCERIRPKNQRSSLKAQRQEISPDFWQWTRHRPALNAGSFSRPSEHPNPASRPRLRADLRWFFRVPHRRVHRTQVPFAEARVRVPSGADLPARRRPLGADRKQLDHDWRFRRGAIV